MICRKQTEIFIRKKDCQQTIFYRWQTLTGTVRVGLRPTSGRGLSWGTQFARGAGAGSLLTQFIHVGAGRAHTAGARVCVVVPTQATGNWQAQTKWCNIYQSTSWPDTGPDIYKDGEKKKKRIICRKKRRSRKQTDFLFTSILRSNLKMPYAKWRTKMETAKRKWPQRRTKLGRHVSELSFVWELISTHLRPQDRTHKSGLW